MDNDLSRGVHARIDESRILVAETRRQVENAKWLTGRQRRSTLVEITEASDVVIISGLNSPEDVMHLCHEIQKWGIRTTIGTLPGLEGHQVLAYHVDLTEVKSILSQLGFKAKHGG